MIQKHINKLKKNISKKYVKKTHTVQIHVDKKYTKQCNKIKNIKGLNIYKIYNVNNYEPVWDCAMGFIVSAKTETNARRLLMTSLDENNHKYVGDEATDIKDFWYNPKYSKCEIIGKSCLSNEQIILVDFNNG